MAVGFSEGALRGATAQHASPTQGATRAASRGQQGVKGWSARLTVRFYPLRAIPSRAPRSTVGTCAIPFYERSINSVILSLHVVEKYPKPA